MPRPATLSPELLQTFVTLEETEGDASQAADILGINQPSMSKRLSRLQHAGQVLKRPWLERTGKSWRLTDEGRRVLPAVKDLLRRYEQLTAFVGMAAPADLHFACGQEALSGFALEAIRAFRHAHPQVRLHLTTLRGQQRIEGVASGALDLAVVTHDQEQLAAVGRRHPLLVEDLYDDPLVLVCAESAGCAAAFKKLSAGAVQGRALIGLPLVLPEATAGIRQVFDGRLRDLGLLPQLEVTAEVGGWATILACVKAGLGVGILPRSVLAREAESMPVRTLHPSINPPNRVRLIARALPGTSEPDLSENALSFRDALRTSATTMRQAIARTSEGGRR
jgi:DNA-binding transcriptional LysR family regulator